MFFFFFWWGFFALIFIGVRWSRPKSGMKNCNLLNRIVPQVFQGLRNFTNESAENLGTKLRDGHKSTIVEPAIARRNQRTQSYPRTPKSGKFLS